MNLLYQVQYYLDGKATKKQYKYFRMQLINIKIENKKSEWGRYVLLISSSHVEYKCTTQKDR